MNFNLLPFKIFLAIVVMMISFQPFNNVACAATAKEYIPEHIRARLPEVRDCFKIERGDNWKNCRANCADICNEIPETYERGVCNGVLIQLCCNEHPAGCN